MERPASVVKELVENAIDAGATQIEVAVGAECRDIRIADDGCGMSPDDAVLAFQRHATSKLRSAEDLSNLRTLGFRGEALPSIASVSKVTCITRSVDSSTGSKLEIEEGKIKQYETGCATGTIIEVCELFYNVPARLKFLKKGSTEFAHIAEIIESLALANPKIVFQLLKQGEVVLKTSGSGKLAETMQELEFVGPKVELLPITGVDMRFGMAVYGHMARPPVCRGDRKGIVTLVNNRPVRCALALKALDYAFSDLIPKGKYPIAVLNVTIDPNQIDVNIHPTKKEIRYSNSSEVYLTIQRALIESTRRLPEPAVPTGIQPESRDQEIEKPEETNAPSLSIARAQEQQALSPASEQLLLSPTEGSYSDTQSAPLVRETREMAAGGKTYQKIQQLGLRDRWTTSAPSRINSNSGTHVAPTSTRKASSLPIGWRLVGYIHNTYMLFETIDGLKIVEQHIAHERVIYERLLAQQETAGRTTEHVQYLVISTPLNLSSSQRASLAENLDQIRSLGFDFDFQPNRISCTQVPLELATKDYAGTLQEIIEQLLNADNANFSLEATKSLACQAAIKNGMPLSEPEIIELISEWHSCPRNDTCPHGRPISLSYSKEKLFDLFHPA